MPIRCMLPVKRWALSSRVAIWATAKPRMALTRIATSSIWEAIRWPCRVPSNRVSSTRMLIYLSNKYRKWTSNLKRWGDDETMLLLGDGPFKVGDVLVVALAADIDDLGEEFVSVSSSFCFVNMEHQFLHNLHQVLFRYLECRWQQNHCQFTCIIQKTGRKSQTYFKTP